MLEIVERNPSLCASCSEEFEILSRYEHLRAATSSCLLSLQRVLWCVKNCEEQNRANALRNLRNTTVTSHHFATLLGSSPSEEQVRAGRALGILGIYRYDIYLIRCIIRLAFLQFACPCLFPEKTCHPMITAFSHATVSSLTQCIPKSSLMLQCAKAEVLLLDVYMRFQSETGAPPRLDPLPNRCFLSDG